MRFVNPLARTLCIAVMVASCGGLSAAEDGTTSTDGACQAWEFFEEIELPAEKPTAKWLDFLVTPPVFAKSRFDLGDLRLYDAVGVEVPYALRVLNDQQTEQAVTAQSFDRSKTLDGASELSLDLGEEPIEHDAVELQLPGSDYRRSAELEGSPDGQAWRLLVKKNVIDFRAGGNSLTDRRLPYPSSRFRYLRVRVQRDPATDTEPFEIAGASVMRQVSLPGEFVEYVAKVEPREPVRYRGNPSSRWLLTLPADQLPVSRLQTQATDAEFSRDFNLEASNLSDQFDVPWQYVDAWTWQRTTGQRSKPNVENFSETRCGRMRLTVTDYLNPPLHLETVTAIGAAREIVFANVESLQGPLRLYYGNPIAELPHYDLERNLPPQLEPKPVRLTPGEEQKNPAFIPPPLALAERWPWAIHLVLASACIVLAALIVNLGRTAIAEHDQREAQAAKA